MSANQTEIVVPRTWRSEALTFAIFIFFSGMSIFLSGVFPATIITGELFQIGGVVLRMHLPLFWFLPALTIFSAIYRIYNVRYTVTDRGVEAEIGILALNRRSTRLWFEDIRSVQTHQTLIERFLGVGTLEISTAATGTIEVIFRGIAVPQEVQEMIQRERDKRQKDVARNMKKQAIQGG